MSVENGEWIMHGLDPGDPSCIHTVEELEMLIEAVGFLPLFAGKIPGFSVEEVTVPYDWWSGNPEVDPWEWRAIIARRGKIAYGKFFNGKAGFISQKWLPTFCNFRRDGYDFDARWEDELASYRQKRIMDLFMGERADNELFSFELKEKAGFGKGGEKGFEGTLSTLQMLTYLTCMDFRQKKNKKGEEYGWAIAVLATPEHVFGSKVVTKEYSKSPEESYQKIVKHVMKLYPSAQEKDVQKLVGRK